METYKFLQGLLNKAELIDLDTNNYTQNIIRLYKKSSIKIILESGFKNTYGDVFWNRDYSTLTPSKIESMRIDKLLGNLSEIAIEKP